VNGYRWKDPVVGMASRFEVTLTAVMADAFFALFG
jgi:hypothetical protein